MEYLVKVEDGFQLSKETSQMIAQFEKMLNDIKKQEEELKKSILEEMEAKNIIKIETDEVAISYIAPTTRESFDSKKLRADNPDLYDEYIKISPVKASVRIKLKEL